MKKRKYSKEELEQMEVMRHSASHVLAAAVIKYFEKEGEIVKLGIGPAIEHGFYYDFDLPRKLTNEDLPEIEKIMEEIKEAGEPFEHRMLSKEDAVDMLTERGQLYKVELANDLEDNELSFYKSGIIDDLCRGPHVADTSKIGAFRLTSIAGAYWRGDEKRPMLTRIYGVGFPTQEELDEHLAWLEEAKARDHRKLGKELDLFCFSDLVGSGLPLFTPKGTMLKEILQKNIEGICYKYGFRKVMTPHIAKIKLFELSGHAQKFPEELFRVNSRGYDDLVIKPVLCPQHTQIYASKLRSYRDLPIRYMESDKMYRAEQSGELSGLTRVLAITVEDGHSFCRVDQVKDEIKGIVNIIKDFYGGLGLWEKHWVSLSVRDYDHPEKYIGDPADWDICEQMLQEVSDEMGLDARKCEGEAAVYGPKIDFIFYDALGREIQIPTVQVDFATPKRFDLHYMDEKAQKVHPVMVHRAILGSYERFIALLLEHFAGKFPLWLSPVQIKMIPIGKDHIEYCQEVASKMEKAGFRVEVNDRDERMQAKIRDAQMEKINYMLIVGDKEIEHGGVAVRSRDKKNLGLMKVEDFIAKAREEVENKE